MSVDFSDFLPVCKRIIRTHAGDALRTMPRNERSDFMEDEAQSLAYTLAECAQDRINELRDEQKALRSGDVAG